MDAFVPFDIPLDAGFDGGNMFVKITQEISKYDIPFAWHFEHYLGINIESRIERDVHRVLKTGGRFEIAFAPQSAYRWSMALSSLSFLVVLGALFWMRGRRLLAAR